MKSFIKLENINLDFPVYDDSNRSFRNTVIKTGKNLRFATTKENAFGKRIVQGLKNINLDITHGDRVAVLGPNGAGKSTLLKLIAGIYNTIDGKSNVQGSITSMLDMGFGFEEDATGYENIIIMNSVMGNNPKEAEKKIENILDFSELGDFIHMPLRTYSSGMRARLAFATAVEGSPDILLIDEFLGTGDHNFMIKSKEKIIETMRNASILLFASHAIHLVEDLCNKGIFMKNGKIIFYGSYDEAYKIYSEDIYAEREK